MAQFPARQFEVVDAWGKPCGANAIGQPLGRLPIAIRSGAVIVDGVPAFDVRRDPAAESLAL